MRLVLQNIVVLHFFHLYHKKVWAQVLLLLSIQGSSPEFILYYRPTHDAPVGPGPFEAKQTLGDRSIDTAELRPILSQIFLKNCRGFYWQTHWVDTPAWAGAVTPICKLRFRVIINLYVFQLLTVFWHWRKD